MNVKLIMQTGLIRRLMIIIFVFLAAFFVYRIFTQQINQAIWVPVPKKDLTIGQQITSAKDVLELKQVPRGFAMDTDIAQTVDEVNGKYVASGVLYAGLPISKKAITDTPPATTPYGLSVGHVSFPLIVSGRLAASAAFVKPGVFIDLFLVTQSKDSSWVLSNPGQPPAVPLITKVKVLDVTKSGNYTVWVLDVTPDQSSALVALDTSKADLFAIVVNPGNADRPAIYGKGGEAK